MTPQEALSALAREIDAWQDEHAMLRGVDARLVRNAREILGSVNEVDVARETNGNPGSPGDPLADADVALRGLFEHDGRRVAGWAVVARVEWLDPDVPADIVPLTQRLDYATSLALPVDGALGLVDALAAKLRRIARRAFVDEE